MDKRASKRASQPTSKRRRCGNDATNVGPSDLTYVAKVMIFAPDYDHERTYPTYLLQVLEVFRNWNARHCRTAD